jgi:hypothetical protein
MNQMRNSKKKKNSRKKCCEWDDKRIQSRLVIDLKHCLTTKFYYLPFPARILILSHFSAAFFFFIFNLHAIAKKTIWDFYFCTLLLLLILPLSRHSQIVHQLTFKVLRVINHTKCSSRRYTFPNSLLAYLACLHRCPRNVVISHIYRFKANK